MSQKKRILEQRRREEEARKAAKQKRSTLITLIVIGVIVIGVIAGALVYDGLHKGYGSSNSSSKEVNYSLGLDDEGYMKGVKTLKYIKLCEFDMLNKNPESFYPSKETEDAYIEGLLSSYLVLDKTEGQMVKTGDTIDVSFNATIDGNAYADGSTNGKTLKCILGSETLPGDLEQKIMGHKTGEDFDVTVSFADDFANEDMAGKDVVYTVNIAGVYKKGEFNDEFIKTNYGDSAGSAQEFLEKYRLSVAEEAFDNYVKDFIIEESEVITYPTSYTKKAETVLEGREYQQYLALNQAFVNLNGTKAYNSILEMKNMTESQYKEHIKSMAREEVKTDLVYQALYEKFGLSFDETIINEVVTSLGYAEDEYEEAEKRYGKPYLRREAMHKLVDKYLVENFNLSE